MPDVSSTSDFFLIIFSAAGSDQAQCLLLWNQSLHPFLLFSAVCHRSPVGADHISVDILSPRQSVRETGQTPSRRRHYNDSCLRRRFQRAYSFCRHLASAVQAGTIHIHCQQTDIFPLCHIFLLLLLCNISCLIPYHFPQILQTHLHLIANLSRTEHNFVKLLGTPVNGRNKLLFHTNG